MNCLNNCSEYLKELVKEYGNHCENPDMTMPFTEMGMDSYDVVDLLLRAEEEFGIVIDSESMLRINCLQDAANKIMQCCKEEETNA